MDISLNNSILDNLKVFHICGPDDFKGTGIADYINNLIEAQNEQGIEAEFISSEYPYFINWNTLSSEAEAKEIEASNLSPLEQNRLLKNSQEKNEFILSGIFKRETSQGIIPLIHLHLNLPLSGSVISPEFLNQYNSCITVHEVDIEEEIGEFKTIDYINTVKSFIITAEDDLNKLKLVSNNIESKAIFSPIPPNICPDDDFIEASYEQLDKEPIIVNFGTIYPEKRIEDVLELQEIIDSEEEGILKDYTSIIIGSVKDVKHYDYLKELIRNVFQPELLNSEFLENAGVDITLFDSKAERTNKELDLLIDSVKKLEHVYKQNAIRKRIRATLHLNATVSEIENILERAKFAYLPYLSGAAPHSGTLAACVSFKNILAVKDGYQTPESYRQSNAFLFIDNPRDAYELFKQYEQNYNSCIEITDKAFNFFKLNTWQNVASITIQAYLKSI
jgi:hypothetical protein